MLLSSLIDAGHAAPDAAADREITGLTADSREVEPGFLFAALPGTVTDGAKFIPMALEKGASAVLGPPEAGAAVPDDTIFIAADDPRAVFAIAAARYYAVQPGICVGVTGTNGKTSVAAFLRQIWTALGHGAASLGTVGVVSPDGECELQHTTPDPVTLHRVLHDLADRRIDHVAIEVSSHGLAQRRTDGVHFAAAAFTNISRDRLDYHASFEDYFAQKMRLFNELLVEGTCAVINADSGEAARVREICEKRGVRPVMVGEAGEDLTLVDFSRDGMSYQVRVRHLGREHEFILPLTGEFQISNALVAAGLAISTGSSPDFVFRAMERLNGAKGRMDLVAYAPSGAPVFVDYSHTPAALENALTALRPFVEGRLICIFGAGGDRDKGKRPEMGEVSCRLADITIVTDDNPRSEDPDAIRREILAGCDEATEIGARAEAIAHGVGLLQAGDVLLVAGKGHESGQEIAGVKHPFSDHDVVRELLDGEHLARTHG